jgi:hypothetical protein
MNVEQEILATLSESAVTSITDVRSNEIGVATLDEGVGFVPGRRISADAVHGSDIVIQGASNSVNIAPGVPFLQLGKTSEYDNARYDVEGAQQPGKRHANNHEGLRAQRHGPEWKEQVGTRLSYLFPVYHTTSTEVAAALCRRLAGSPLFDVPAALRRHSAIPPCEVVGLFDVTAALRRHSPIPGF